MLFNCNKTSNKSDKHYNYQKGKIMVPNKYIYKTSIKIYYFKKKIFGDSILYNQKIYM